MHETPADLAALQGLLDRSYATAGVRRRGAQLACRAVAAASLALLLLGWRAVALLIARSRGQSA